MDSARTNLLSSEFFLKLSRLSYFLAKKASLHEGLDYGDGEGGSFEFEDYRSYYPGDDLRHLDWNVYARTERFYLKRFVQERDQSFALYLDLSKKMDFGTPNKFDVALQIAAGISYLALHQKSKVKIFAGSQKNSDSKTFEGIHQIKPLLQYLSSLEPEESKGINTHLRRLFPFHPQTSIVLSDFLEPALFKEFQLLLERKLSFGLIQIIAPEEENPKFQGWWKLSSRENGETKEVRLNQSQIENYKHVLANHRESLRLFALKHRLSFISSSSLFSFEEWMQHLHLEGRLFTR